MEGAIGMNKVMLVGRLTRDPELRSLPSGKHVATFTIATNEFRGSGGERAEYHPCVAWDRLAEICGQFLTKGQLVDVEGRLQTRQWDDKDGNKRYTTEIKCDRVTLLGGGGGGGARRGGDAEGYGGARGGAGGGMDEPPVEPITDDDIPF
jgi:single-strand DNA-binding protein